MMGQIALIALGSNKISDWGNPTATICAGIASLRRVAQAPPRISSFFVTQAYPAGSGPDFVNAAVALHTTWQAPELLAELHRIESEAQRSRDIRWGPRTLDLDLIALGDEVWPDIATQTRWRDLAPEDQARIAPDQLILPHPRLQDRSFVLVPLAEVAPDWRHPVLRLTIADMLARLAPADTASVVRLDGATI